MKKKISVILSIIMLSLTLISCNKSISLPPVDNEESQTDTSTPDTSEPVITDDKDDKNKDETPNKEVTDSTVDNTESQTDTPVPNPIESEITNNNDEISNNKVTDSNIDTGNNSTTDNISNKEDRSVRLYFYDVVTDNIVYYDDVIEVTDKAVTTALINALKYPSNSSVTPSIPESIGVTSAKLDQANNTFTVDFPANLVSEMNLGSGPESSTLKSIVNTLGYNFGVDNVIITLGGSPYSSGHISMSEGESFSVSLDNTTTLN